MLPQEKTFNVAAISDKSLSVGFAVPVSVVSLGLAASDQKQSFFVYRDADTIARYDGPGRFSTLDKEAIEATSFGWSFRPVLGRDYVEPGIRQVFVALALDENDTPDAAPTLYFSIKSGWRDLKDRMAAKEGVASSLTTLAPKLIIPANKTISEKLLPVIDEISLSPFSEANALVSLAGKNYFSGTAVLIGDQVINESNPQMFIPSNQALRS